jgi:two-component system, sensor histidine kinase and response regulator
MTTLNLVDQSTSSRVHLSPTVLHDLRTPLNQIIGYSEMLVEQAEDEGLAFVPDLQKILISGRHLLGAINDNFDVAAEKDVTVRPIAQPIARANGSTSARVGTSTEERSPHAAPLAGAILVVDDGHQNRDVLSKRLVRLGHEVVAVASGIDALATMRSQPFDLVLLDIMMPAMDGFEVLRRLKSDATLSHIPVVMISALSDVENIARCIALGADDYLTKPFDTTLLKARVGACLVKKQSRDREQQLFHQLAASFERLQALEKQRDDLTNMIVHDLKTPLTSMMGGLNNIALAGSLNGDQQEMLGISIAGGDLLLGMINDLLDVDKLSSGAMQLNRVSLSVPDVIVGAVVQVSYLAEVKRLSIVYDIAEWLPAVTADKEKLSRIIVNLLGNAIKFTPSNGCITVSAKLGFDRKFLEISVSDTGEGIPPEALGLIFEKFGQVPSRSGGRSTSTGLGLAFCKLAAQAHGGEIHVTSELGVGSKFTFTLPCDSPLE